MSPRAKLGLTALGIVLAVGLALGVAWYAVSRSRVQSEALVSLGGQKRHYADGRGVEIVIAGNSFDQTKVVVVMHCSTIDPSRRILKPGQVFTDKDPVGPMMSSYRLTTHYPPDPSISGLWIDGSERDIRDGLTAVYISDKIAATDLAIADEQQAEFVADARRLDPLEFIEKWVSPQVQDNKPIR